MTEISATTKKLYRSHSRRFEGWLAENGKAPSEPESWVIALQSLTRSLSKKTWRLYRNALAWHLKNAYGEQFAGRFMLATDMVVKPPEKKKKLLRRIEPEILQAVVRELLSRRGERPKRLADMMIAMVTTGMRQKEFETAKLMSGDELVLVVQNAKYRKPSVDLPGRANGQFRYLLIHPDTSPALLGSVTRSIEWCSGRPWSAMAPNANRLFRAVIKKLVTKRLIGTKWNKLRLYDCRHQFSANAKANLDLLAGEVAAAMGHRSVVTAVSHYGKRQFAKASAMMVAPSVESVQAVSQLSIQKARRGMAKRSGLPVQKRQINQALPQASAGLDADNKKNI